MFRFQMNVWDWFKKCFPDPKYKNPRERTFRFVEEAIELAQACGASREEVSRIADYVYGRPVGEIRQEVGGVMVTLSTLCSVHKICLSDAAEKELARIDTPEVIFKIREKQATKVQGNDDSVL